MDGFSDNTRNRTAQTQFYHITHSVLLKSWLDPLQFISCLDHLDLSNRKRRENGEMISIRPIRSTWDTWFPYKYKNYPSKAHCIQSSFSLLPKSKLPTSLDHHVNRRQTQQEAWVQSVSITFHTIKTNEHIYRRRLPTFSSTLSNPNVSEEAKQNAQAMLNEIGGGHPSEELFQARGDQNKDPMGVLAGLKAWIWFSKLIRYADWHVYRAQNNPGVTEGGKQEATEKMKGMED